MPVTDHLISAGAASAELSRIQHWWLEHCVDPDGGFLGEIDHRGQVVPGANKAVVLHCRILWFFSAHAAQTGDSESLAMAERGYRYLIEHFDDPTEGGVYWELSADGNPLNIRKQTYACCYAIYALTAYHRATGSGEALTRAHSYFELLERRARNHCCGGYFEAFSRNWVPLQDTRLGPGDHNYPIKMNTHLHAIEAFSSLYHASPDKKVEQRLRELLGLFDQHFIDSDNGRLRQCFDLHWQDRSPIRSYGHDLEAAWLLSRAAQRIGDEDLQTRFDRHLLNIADTCLDQGMAARGHLYSKVDLTNGERDETSVWWAQAEALIGFACAFRASGNLSYLDACDRIWRALAAHLDVEVGEWHAETINGEARLTPDLYKAGPWKGPYHNGRAMLQLMNLLEQKHVEAGHVRAN